MPPPSVDEAIVDPSGGELRDGARHASEAFEASGPPPPSPPPAPNPSEDGSNGAPERWAQPLPVPLAPPP
eukprot:1764226-Prymnesium_polylepis.1